MSKKPIVWTIAGSDSGGGAGIQADLHCFQMLGVQGCSAITAVTAQNSIGIDHIEPVSLASLTAQIDSLASDLPPTVIKIGMLTDPEQVRLLASKLQRLRQQNPDLKVVYDPVMSASTGSALTRSAIDSAIKEHLFTHVDVLTPNALEASQLTGIDIVDYPSLQLAADRLRAMGVTSVVIKGGHSKLVPGHCIDYLRSDQFESDATEMVLAQPRHNNPHSHGSGCSYASAIAAALALDYSLEDAVIIANAYVYRGITEASPVGAGPGPVAHGSWPESPEHFPSVVLPGSAIANEMNWQSESSYPQQGFAQCDTRRLGLYPVVDSCEWLERLLKLGVKTLQLRVKNLPDNQLRETMARAIELGRQYQARLFINDYWQLAIELGAYGIHLGQEDMERADLQTIQASGLKLGLSSHGYFEMLRALAVRPSYVACGAIYPTTTKTMPSRPQGLTKLKRYLKLTGNTPVVAIGGINVERAAEVAATGVGSIAVVTAITEATDYSKTSTELAAVMK